MIRTISLLLVLLFVMRADPCEAQRLRWLGEQTETRAIEPVDYSLDDETYAEEWAVGGAIVLGLAGGLFTRAACFAEAFGPGDCNSFQAFLPGIVVGGLVGAGVGWLVGKQLPQAADHGG